MTIGRKLTPCTALAPAKTYPMPMKQGVLALNHLLAKGCSPENVRATPRVSSRLGTDIVQIALSGDSAGGHLCLSIISHILHPHPDVTPVLPLIAPLAAAIIISGWVSFSETAESYTANEGIDLVSKAFVSYWVEEAFGKGVAKEEGAAGRHHVEALEAPETWWEGLGQAVKFVGLTGGRFELLRDCIVELGEKLKVKGALSAEVDVLIGKSEVHDGPLIDFMNGIQRPPSVISQGVADYLGEAFK